MKTTAFLCVLPGLAFCVSTGCSDTSLEVTSSAATTEFVNTLCPIMGNKVDTSDPSVFREWNGKKVGFCCPPCLEEWDELTDAEKTDKLAHPEKADGDSSHDHAVDEHASPNDSAAATELSPSTSESPNLIGD